MLLCSKDEGKGGGGERSFLLLLAPVRIFLVDTIMQQQYL